MSAPHFEKCQEDRPRTSRAGGAGERRRTDGACEARCGRASHCIINPLKFSHVFESFHNKMMGGGGDMCILKGNWDSTFNQVKTKRHLWSFSSSAIKG